MFDWENDVFLSTWDKKYVSTNLRPGSKDFDAESFKELQQEIDRSDVVGRIFDQVTADMTPEDSMETFKRLREAITIVYPFLGMPSCIPACYGVIGVIQKKGSQYASDDRLRSSIITQEDMDKGQELRQRVYHGVGNSEIFQLMDKYFGDLFACSTAITWGYLISKANEHVFTEQESHLIVASAIIALGAARQARSHIKATIGLGNDVLVVKSVVNVVRKLAKWAGISINLPNVDECAEEFNKPKSNFAVLEMSFTNLVRFEDDQGAIHYGDVPEDCLLDIIGCRVPILAGDPFEDSLQLTGQQAVVYKVLPPIESVPVFLCIGLNYAEHAKEANLPIPPSPVLFIKPADALAGPHDQIEIPDHAKMLDYEGELCFIVKRDAKNISASQAQEYILGYTAGNDISSRLWQRPPLAGGQYCYAKGFDKFAPIGPTVRHASKITMDSVSLQTLVNGKERQSTLASDMLFSPSKILEHLSSGCTVRKGTVVMTGTPSGIAGRMKGEPWLRDGDVVEVCISGIGKITNQIVMPCHNRL
ncbi:hypothetical protein N7499_009595 [Penicillium canescens]|nr:hypothetical protein N7499_009595 [Penicillium canescens]KAJ6170261.1 hypothetical protein N7485_007607 [Penicillium canescens]